MISDAHRDWWCQHTFLSGMILTFCTWPVVSKIWRRTSSVTRGSRPPTYRALLFGSGAARRAKGPPLLGGMMPLLSPLPMGDVMAVGMGLLFCGMCRGGGGMCAPPEPPFWLLSKPGAPAFGWGGGGRLAAVEGGTFSAMMVKDALQRRWSFQD